MGSPASEAGRGNDESPQHKVTFDKQFAVGRFAVTFEEWDACVADNGCMGSRPNDNGWGHGYRPVINVSWFDAKAYAEWLSRKSGQSYRLLSEAEYEYAGRAGSVSAYPWGNEIGRGTPIAKAAATSGTASRRLRLARSPPTRSDSMTWPATRGSGRRIAITSPTAERRRTAQPGQLATATPAEGFRASKVSVSSAAVIGSAIR